MFWKKKEEGDEGYLIDCRGRTRIFWGILFVILGGYFLAEDMGLVPPDFPFWSLFILGIGLYLLLTARSGK